MGELLVYQRVSGIEDVWILLILKMGMSFQPAMSGNTRKRRWWLWNFQPENWGNDFMIQFDYCNVFRNGWVETTN